MVNKKSFSWKTFIVCIVLAYVPAIVGGLFVSDVSGGWYDSVRPSITPPSWLFGPVWTILYFMIACSLYRVWTRESKSRTKIIWLYGFNLAFNALWTIFYFGMHNPLLSFVDIILIWLSIIGMMVVSWKVDRKATYLLVPYFLWVSFASILNWLSI